MAKLNDEAQWIIMMGFIISISIFFLAIVVNESTLVGQTTAEGVLEFPKSDIQDLRDEVFRYVEVGDLNVAAAANFTANGKPGQDIQNLSLFRKNALVSIHPEWNPSGDVLTITIHYNNGVTSYNEITQFTNY